MGVFAPIPTDEKAYRLANLAAALRTFDLVCVWDNSADRQRPYLVLEIQQRALTHRARELPSWLSRAVAGTELQALLDSLS